MKRFNHLLVSFFFCVFSFVNAQNAGGGSNPPTPKGSSTPGGSQGEVPIDDYIPLFFVSGIALVAYFKGRKRSIAN